MLIVRTALACEYGNLHGSAKQDGQTLGTHSIRRLEKMWAGFLIDHNNESDPTVFVFGAGHMSPEQACLYELQAEWVRKRWIDASFSGEPSIIIPYTDMIWGTDGELTFLDWVVNCLKVSGKLVVVEISTEDYHGKRTRLLVERLGLVAEVETTSSAEFPPSAEELRHEKRSYFVQCYCPKQVVTFLQKLSRRVRARRYGLL